METKKMVVVGGGAAGFFCAIQIAQQHPDWDISILEKSNKLLSKVKVSGGGRCNVTHACPDVELLLKKYPRGARFLKKAFYQFATKNTIQWFADNGVQLHTEKDGRMFPTTNNSETIIDCFLQKVHQYKIKILTEHEVINVEKSTKENKNSFLITLSNKKTMQADAICLATGGMLKSDKLPWLISLGHSIVAPVPSLFTFNVVEKNITTLMGVAVDNAIIQWRGNKISEKGPLLITHWGISGPAAIKLSAWCARELANDNYEGAIVINWTPEYNEATLKMEWINLRMDFGKREMGSKNPFNLPQRLWQFLLVEAGILLNTKWADLKSPQQQLLIQSLTRTTLTIKGKTTFKEEFVTCGGVDLSEIEASTMESKLVPGLHFAGEMMDVDGITGGFNFQHAWTSGWLAAQHMGQMD
ncbi:MAG: NAD(P)/FAD-dependent oxidoreductase [Bacteroidetes bacterium]|nr:NAD(P)/FAD-dependent oxidoreductase [Bacteroidota bacterium]